jgi:glycosyltransferase involved in cell wall biosynthesis
MGEVLGLAPARVHRVPLGIPAEGFGQRSVPLPERPFVVGYLARICPEKGLHLLLDAFRLLAERVDWVGEVDLAGKVAFLDSLHAMSVPTVYREPKGRSILEALASAVPVVLPAHGAFPEIVEASRGGLLFEPGSVEALADALGKLAADPALRQDLGRRGQTAVRRDFSAEAMAREMLRVYAKHLTFAPIA